MKWPKVTLPKNKLRFWSLAHCSYSAMFCKLWNQTCYSSPVRMRSAQFYNPTNRPFMDQLPLLKFLPTKTIPQAEFRKSNSFRIWYFPLNCPNESCNIAKYEDFSFNYNYTRSKSRCYFTLKDAYLPQCSFFEINLKIMV